MSLSGRLAHCERGLSRVPYAEGSSPNGGLRQGLAPQGKNPSFVSGIALPAPAAVEERWKLRFCTDVRKLSPCALYD